MKNFFEINRALAAKKNFFYLSLAAKKQKLYTLLLALIASVGTMFAETFSGTCGDNLTWSLNTEDSTLTITGSGAMYDYSYPYRGPWIENNSLFIKYLSLSNGITSIGNWAFAYCSGLTSIEIPNSVTSIGSYAFYECTGLTSVTIPNSVTSIGKVAFSGCTGLTSVHISDIAAWCNISFGDSDMYGYGTNPLYNARHLYLNNAEVTNLVIPNSVTSIGKEAFQGCTGITSITIPRSVTSIGGLAFYGCSGLTSITIPSSVTNIGINPFITQRLLSISVEAGNPVYDSRNNCNAIIETKTNTLITGCKNTVIPNSVTSIGNRAFEGCTGLTSITIPNSVTSIVYWAFAGCSDLTSITIPNSVTSIGAGAFIGCSGLTNITIPNSVTSIGDDAFEGCTGLTSVTIGNSVTSIEGNTFRGCTGLTSITIPNSVTSIGGSAFEGCTGLTSVTIGNSVTSIGWDAFHACSGLTSVTIPNSVTSIGDRAFYGCTGLTSITIPNSVKWIERDAFYGCTGLTSVTIGNSVEYIGSSAFYECSGLSSIYNYATTPQSISTVFYRVDKSTCTLYVPAGSINLYKTAYEWKDFKNILPISAEEKNIDTVEVETSESTVSIAWPQVSGAYSYTLVIKDASGNTICTLVFNAQGQLTSIALHAPSRNNAPQQTQTAGFAFTVTGLDSGTIYNYTLTAKNASGATLKIEQGTFTTKSPQAIDHVSAANSSHKFLRDGQIFILRGDKTYTITGAEVR